MSNERSMHPDGSFFGINSWRATSSVCASSAEGSLRLGVWCLLLSVCSTAFPGDEVAEPPQADKTAVAAGVNEDLVRIAQPSRLLLADEYSSTRLVGDDVAFRRTQQALRRPCALEARESALRDVLSDVSERTGLSIRFDYRALEESGVDTDFPISVVGSDREPLKDTLKKMLKDLDLTILVDDAGVVVTTVDAANEMREARVYPLNPTTDAEQLADVIRNAIEPHSWDVVGASGHIGILRGDVGLGLVISQSQDTHDQVLAFLANLDRMAWGDSSAERDARVTVRIYRVRDCDLRRELGMKLTGLCRESLGTAGDPDAAVTVVGDSLVVRSKSRAMHVMAATLISAISGGSSAPLPELPVNSGGMF